MISDEAALPVGKVPPRGSSHAGSSEGIGADAETSPGTERIARRLKSKSPRAEASTKTGADAPEDKAQDPERVTMRTTGVFMSTDPRIAPHAAETTGNDCSSTNRHAVGKAIAQPVSLHTPPIQPGGVMIPLGSQDRRTVGCATAPNTAGMPNATENQPPRPGGRTAAGQEATSAQVVERGHQVAMIEVPDKEDDTAYQRWLAKGSPIVTLT